LSVTLPAPPPPELGDPRLVDPDALIREARRRARRRRQRNFVGILAAVLGVLWFHSLLRTGGAESGGASAPARAQTATPPKVALPEELSFNANGGIVLVRRDGTRRVLTPGVVQRLRSGRRHLGFYGGVDWSPDGSKLLARRWGPERGLVVINTNGKVTATIGRRALDGRWSPDGTRIAFVQREPEAGRVLFVASSDGRTATRIAARLPVFGDPAFSWSPDGTELAYAGQGAARLFIADSSGRRAPRPVAIATGGRPAMKVATVQWSPDGSLIAFTSLGSAREAVYVVRRDGTAPRHVADGYAIAWSPNGRLLAFAGPAGPTWGDVSVVNPDGTGLRRIARCRCGLRGPGSSQSVAWSSDGTRIAYISARGNTVSTIRPDGSGAAVVATQGPRGLTGNWYPSLPLWRPTP
jgi:Tol biopolymer transport system component